MSTYELFIALRHLQSRRTRFVSTITVIAVLGVFLGVMALTSVVAVTGGFQRAFQDRVLGINSHILVIKYGADFHGYRDVQQELDGLEGVEGSSPFVLHEMVATSDGHTSGVLVKGIDPTTLADVSDLPSYVDQPGTMDELAYDRFPPDGELETPKLLLGDTLADKLAVEEGDRVRITSPLKNMEPGGWSSDGKEPASDEFVVAGTYSSGFYEYDSRLVMVDYRAMQEFLERGDVVTGIDLRVEDVFQVGETVERIYQLLPSEDYRIMDWRELNHNLFTSLRLQRVVLGILFCFIVLVASFNIVCTLIMIVLDKKKEIAILKSMGATGWGIMKIFVVQGSLIGAVGTINGLLGGLGVCFLIESMNFGLDPSIYMIDHLPVDIRLYEFALVGAVAMVISVLATIGPAWWASRLSPVEGLRYEA